MKLKIAKYTASEDWHKNYSYVDPNPCQGLHRVTSFHGKYGFVNLKGEEICELKYDYVYDFENGLAEVKLNSKYGFVNLKGEEVVPPKYEFVGDFEDGFAEVVLNDKWGYIDTDGDEVVPPEYSHEEYEDPGEALAEYKRQKDSVRRWYEQEMRSKNDISRKNDISQ